MVPKSGCVFKVRNGPKGESQNIYIGCPTKNAVTVTRTSILESASYYLKNCQSIRKTTNEERIISTVCAQIVSENLIMRSILYMLPIFVCVMWARERERRQRVVTVEWPQKAFIHDV